MIWLVIKSFVHGHLPTSQKYFLIYRTNFDYCLQTKEKNQSNKNTFNWVIHNFHFLVLDYLESWLNLMIVSVFVLESRQVGNIQNHESQTQWLSISARLNTIYRVKIFQNVTQNLLSQNYANLLYTSLSYTKFSIYRKQFQRLLSRRTSILFVNDVIMYLLRNITQKLINTISL